MGEMDLFLTVRMPLAQTDVHWLEAQLLEWRTQFFREALHAVVAQIDVVGLLVARCPICSGPLVGDGRMPLVLETLLGRVENTRQRVDARAVRWTFAP